MWGGRAWSKGVGGGRGCVKAALNMCSCLMKMLVLLVACCLRTTLNTHTKHTHTHTHTHTHQDSMAELLRTGTSNKLKTGGHNNHTGATHDAGGLGDMEAVSLVLQVTSRVKLGMQVTSWVKLGMQGTSRVKLGMKNK